MEIIFLELTDEITILDSELKERIKQASRTKISKGLLVKIDNIEIAYVCLDIFPNDKNLVLYELYIQSKGRRKGFGASILIELEKMAINLGFQSIVVRPVPISKDISEEKLIAWYKSNSYVETDDDSGLLIKYI